MAAGLDVSAGPAADLVESFGVKTTTAAISRRVAGDRG